MIMKSLVAYFSRADKNYVNGNIVDLPVGNTEIIANKIKDLTNSDIFTIKTMKPYPADYRKTVDIAREELNNDLRPELAGNLDSIDEYDVIYIGYPNFLIIGQFYREIIFERERGSFTKHFTQQFLFAFERTNQFIDRTKCAHTGNILESFGPFDCKQAPFFVDTSGVSG